MGVCARFFGHLDAQQCARYPSCPFMHCRLAPRSWNGARNNPRCFVHMFAKSEGLLPSPWASTYRGHPVAHNVRTSRAVVPLGIQLPKTTPERDAKMTGGCVRGPYLMCDSFWLLHGHQAVEVEWRAPLLEVEEDANGVGTYLTDEAMLVVPQVVDADAGDGEAFGQVGADSLNAFAPAGAGA